MSLMTDEEMTDLQQQRVPWEATCRAIEAIALERGRQQGLMEAVEICEQYRGTNYGKSAECVGDKIREHAAKGRK